MSTPQEQERERDIEAARQFYAELLAFELRMEMSGKQMHNRGRWNEALGQLRKAQTSLHQFIGERMTKDLDEAHAAKLVAAYEEQP